MNPYLRWHQVHFSNFPINLEMWFQYILVRLSVGSEKISIIIPLVNSLFFFSSGLTLLNIFIYKLSAYWLFQICVAFFISGLFRPPPQRGSIREEKVTKTECSPFISQMVYMYNPIQSSCQLCALGGMLVFKGCHNSITDWLA